MNNYAFTDAAGATVDLNALKIALASRGQTIEGLARKTQVNQVNATTLPAAPSRGYAQLFATPSSGSTNAFVGHMAIWLNGHWLFVPAEALNYVAQNYRAAQYSYNTATNMWDETVTDPLSEGGAGPAGVVGERGLSLTLSKFPGGNGVVKESQQVATAKRLFNIGKMQVAIDNGEPGYIPASIFVGYPILHVAPPTGGEYYTVCRPRATVLPTNTRIAGGALETNRDIGTAIPENALVRFEGICAEDREVTLAANDTSMMPFRYTRNCTVREDELYRTNVDTTAQTGANYMGREHSGVNLLFLRTSGTNFFVFQGWSSQVGPTLAGTTAGATYLSVYVNTGQRFSSRTGATTVLHFRSEGNFQQMA